MSDIVLEARDVRQVYRIRGGWGRKAQLLQAVRSVSLSVERGSVLGIVGESGCGKSTLARLMLGLERPSSGSIHLGGTDVAKLGRKAVARRLQPIFQDPYASLNPRRTILGSVEAPLAVHGIGSASERRRKAMDMMDRVGLPARFAERYPAELSGGQRQRVAIARALALEPEIVICDEPTSALDVSVQAQILNLLADLRRDLGLTYVLISHNLGVIEHMASRVAVMYLGAVVEEAATADLFAAPKHPYTRALLASVLTPVPGLGLPDTGLGLIPPDPTAVGIGCAFAPRCRDVMDVCRMTAPALGPVGGAETRVACHLHDQGHKSAAAA